MQNLTPQQIVTELDKYIIGQGAAKKSVAVAIRNRWRRQQLEADMAREVYPKNIVMIGPTGVGKTEIARRLSHLTGAPFVKVEASKFTEVGYHGRDVESMIRDLADQAVSMVRSEEATRVRTRATESANQRLVDLLLPSPPTPGPAPRSSPVVGIGSDLGIDPEHGSDPDREVDRDKSQERLARTRQRLLDQVVAGKLDDREVELTITQRPATQVMFANMGMDQMDPELANMFERLIPEQSKRRRLSVAEARQVLIEQETDKLLDSDKITAEAIRRTEESGIIFLDEIDKIATPGGAEGRGGYSGGGGGSGGPDVSRQGVQRDLLPIVEGSTVNTRYGIVHTDHVLFIAAGAFHSASVNDLMPELQGRFPIRVELSSLTRDDFVRILTEPDNALTKQQQALLAVEGLKVSFERESIDAVADLAAQANASLENIGARRLMTIVEKVFDQINFDAPEMVARGDATVTISAQFVREQVASIVQDEDLSKFVL